GQAEAGDAGPGRRRESIASVSYVQQTGTAAPAVGAIARGSGGGGGPPRRRLGRQPASKWDRASGDSPSSFSASRRDRRGEGVRSGSRPPIRRGCCAGADVSP